MEKHTCWTCESPVQDGRSHCWACGMALDPIKAFYEANPSHLGLYSRAYVEAFYAARNEDGPKARRALRARRIQDGRTMRLSVSVYQGASYEREEYTCEVYGWRAALAAVRAMRAHELTEYRIERARGHSILDARLVDVIEGMG